MSFPSAATDGESSKEGAYLSLAVFVYPQEISTTVLEPVKDDSSGSEIPSNSSATSEPQRELPESAAGQAITSLKGKGKEKAVTTPTQPALTRPDVPPLVSGIPAQRNPHTGHEFLTAFPKDWSGWEALFRALHSSLKGENRARLCHRIGFLNRLQIQIAAWEHKDQVVTYRYEKMMEYNIAAEKRHLKDEETHKKDVALTGLLQEAQTPRNGKSTLEGRQRTPQRRDATDANPTRSSSRRSRQKEPVQTCHPARDHSRQDQQRAERQKALNGENITLRANLTALSSENTSLKAQAESQDAAIDRLKSSETALTEKEAGSAYNHIQAIIRFNNLEAEHEKEKDNEIKSLNGQTSASNAALQEMLDSTEATIASLTAALDETVAAAQTSVKNSKEYKEIQTKVNSHKTDLNAANDELRRLRNDVATDAKKRSVEKKSSDAEIQNLKNQVKTLKANKESKTKEPKLKS
ncbi:hypothetical protein BKA61DRAFT_568128 [Leptodontidium sp. MPI-SDFR-AT-0119]|nr:hypothetical protein BKA61DRAFT_568128 [Leptodontidium sp. MPI-SDFR-AT-0119]